MLFFGFDIYYVSVCVRMFTFSIRSPQAIRMREGVLSCIYSCLYSAYRLLIMEYFIPAGKPLCKFDQ